MSTSPTTAVAFDDPADETAARSLASSLGLPFASELAQPCVLHLVIAAAREGQRRLELRVVEPGHSLAGGHGVAADFTTLNTTSGAGRSLTTPLLKAVGIKRGHPYRPTLLDLTAGLGEDAWLLAAAGCAVTAVERQPLIHALLADALGRARATAPDIADRIALQPCAEGLAFLAAQAADSFEVVTLDPMFPQPAGDRKALERKPMRVLRLLAGDDPDADALLPQALRVARRRVVVKRPRHATPLARRAPGVSHEGKGFRFDVYAGDQLQ